MPRHNWMYKNLLKITLMRVGERSLKRQGRTFILQASKEGRKEGGYKTSDLNEVIEQV